MHNTLSITIQNWWFATSDLLEIFQKKKQPNQHVASDKAIYSASNDLEINS
jgi:hypothetical protein